MASLLGYGIAGLFRNAPLDRIGQTHAPTQPGRLLRPDQADRDDVGIIAPETEQQQFVSGLHLRDFAGGEVFRVRSIIGYLQEVRRAAVAFDLHVIRGAVPGIVYPADEVRLFLPATGKPAGQAGNGRRQRDVRIRRVLQQRPIGLWPVAPWPPYGYDHAGEGYERAGPRRDNGTIHDMDSIWKEDGVMDVHDYGRHFSGFERPTRPRRLRDRYPYLTGLLWLTVLAGSLLWLLTHDGCAHPLGNTIALIVYVAAGCRLLLPWMLRKVGPYLTE